MNENLTVNIVSAPKGGIGKSYICGTMAEVIAEAGKLDAWRFIDIDTNNRTFSSLKGVSAEFIGLYTGRDLDKTLLDPMVKEMLADKRNYLIDTGGASFRAMSDYITDSKLDRLLKKAGKRLVIHSVVCGGGEMGVSIEGFKQVAEWLPEHADLVVWFNEWRSNVEFDGVHFKDSPIYKQHESRIVATARLKLEAEELRKASASQILCKRTFASCADAPETELDVITKGRIETVAEAFLPAVRQVVFR